ncbi:MAG: hypothetical protein EPO40_20945 [Myxococcaceae bacterium]|nr:MAG: hypothetical protein EPO40_20945 [Myxococcaceae bacterium]
MKRPALAAILSLCPLAASADPLVVHTATPRSDRGISAADRLRLGDAVAEVLATGQPEVLRASDTHARVETLSPAGLACDAAECASALLTPLHARGVVVVSVARGRHRQVSLTLRWLDAQGVVRGEQRAQEVVAGWDDAIAMARVSARTLLSEIPPVAPAAPAPTPAPIVEPTPAASAALPPPVIAPPRTRWVTTRRPIEAALGGALLAGGATALTIGLVAIAQDGQQVTQLPNGREEVYDATTRDTVLVVAGAAAVAGGVFLLIDGLRPRRSQVALTWMARPLGDGAWVGLGGRL